jgi:hypothetical protein
MLIPSSSMAGSSISSFVGELLAIPLPGAFARRPPTATCALQQLPAIRSGTSGSDLLKLESTNESNGQLEAGCRHFTKQSLNFLISQVHPSTFKNPHSLVLVFMFRPLSFQGSLTRSPPLVFYKLDLLFLIEIKFRSLVSCS